MAERNPDRGLFKRGRRWYLRLYVRGVGKKIFALKPEGSTHAVTDKAVARAIARRIRQSIKAPSRGQPAPDLPALIEQFEKIVALSSQPKQSRRSVAIVRQFTAGMKSPSEITTPRVQEHLADLQGKGRAPSTITNHRASISLFCGFLKERGLMDGNPAREVKVPKIERSVPIFLTEKQAEQALRIAREHGVYAEIATALFTGLRRAELQRVKWLDINHDNRTLVVPRTKSGRPRTVPLSEEALAVLQEQQQVAGHRKYVFPGRQRFDQSGMRRLSWWTDAIKPIQEAMPVFQQRSKQSVGRGWHLLRHTFASRLAQRGVSLYKIGEWLGHADMRMTRIYAHLAPQYDADIEKLHRPKNDGSGEAK